MNLTHHDALDYRFVRAAQPLIRALRWFHPTRIEGADRLPEGPALLVGNHGLLGYESLLFGGPDEAVKFWLSLRWPELLWGGLRTGIRRGGLLDTEAFRARVDADVDYEALLRAPNPVGFIVCDLESGKVSVRGNRTEKTADDLARSRTRPSRFRRSSHRCAWVRAFSRTVGFYTTFRSIRR